jgi:hypothetical protein
VTDAWDFSDIPLPETVTEGATLEDMLAEGREIRRRGTVFVAVAPSIAELPAITRLLNAAAEAESDEQGMRVQFALGRRLLRVRDGDGIRPSTDDELARCWSLRTLSQAIADAVSETGLGREGNA